MADFQYALKILLLAEGPGGTIDPHDPGGLTVWGVTMKYEKEWPGWVRFLALQKGTAKPVLDGKPVLWHDDGQLMACVATYYRDVWESLLLDGIKSDVVATAFLGAFVNEGPKVVRWLQAAAGARVDGSMGPLTIDSVNAAPCVWEKFSIQRLKYYTETANEAFLRGLFSRVLIAGA